MKITKEQLQKMIKEELKNVLDNNNKKQEKRRKQ